MNRTRIGILLILYCLPIVFLVGFGSYSLWMTEWGHYAWWPMLACFATALFLAIRWQRRRMLLTIDFTPNPHWTERDRQAWKLIEEHAGSSEAIPAEQFTQGQFYFDTAQQLALKVAKVYQPGASDPYGHLTVPELLSVAELAARDLNQLVRKYLPGSHLLTVNDWKSAKEAVAWYRTLSNLYWAASAALNPVQTGLRYAAAKVGISAPTKKLQENLLYWFYQAFVQRLGMYLIEVNNRNLSVGVARYDELRRQFGFTGVGAQTAEELPSNPDSVPESVGVTIGVLGQVKVGKSSTVNALLGAQRARVDSQPATAGIARYELPPSAGVPRLTFLDSAGYQEGATAADVLDAAVRTAIDSDILLLVLHAQAPGRAADIQLLDEVMTRLAAQPNRHVPKVIAVLTHVDLLSPRMEWQPPYNPTSGERVKEQQMRAAVAAVRDQFGSRLDAVIPVRSDAGEEWNIDALERAIDERLDQGRATAFRRALHREATQDAAGKVIAQVTEVGKEVLDAGKRLLTDLLTAKR